MLRGWDPKVKLRSKTGASPIVSPTTTTASPTTTTSPTSTSTTSTTSKSKGGSKEKGVSKGQGGSKGKGKGGRTTTATKVSRSVDNDDDEEEDDDGYRNDDEEDDDDDEVGDRPSLHPMCFFCISLSTQSITKRMPLIWGNFTALLSPRSPHTPYTTPYTRPYTTPSCIILLTISHLTTSSPGGYHQEGETVRRG